MLLSQDKPAPEQPSLTVEEDPHQVVHGILAGRGIEVLETARRYYPAEVGKLEGRLAELVRAGRLKGPISGEELYSFLRRLGLDFNLDIKIRVSEHGKLKSLEEKFRERNH